MIPDAARHLMDALAAFKPDEYLALAKRAGVTMRAVQRAAAGVQIRADSHLKLCAAVGIRVATGQAARQIDGASVSMISRLENGRHICISGVIAICKFIGTEPEHYAKASADMFHVKPKSETAGASA